ncbi:MAG: T9SS type A sorting domain-containing protein [Bacteroidia bacterium]
MLAPVWGSQGSSQYTPNIRNYDIYVAKDTGVYQLWLPNTTAKFTGTIDHTYRFFSIPKSEDGQVEFAPAQYDAITTITDTLTGIHRKSNTAALSLSLYPNPSTGELNLALAIPESGIVQVEMLDMTSRRITAMQEKHFSHGTHNWHLGQATTIHPGIYFVRLTINGRQVVKKWVKTE